MYPVNFPTHQMSPAVAGQALRDKRQIPWALAFQPQFGFLYPVKTLIMQKWLCTLGLLYAFHANAQSPGIRAPEKYTALFIEPLAAIDNSNGMSVRAGAEHRFSHHWSLSATGGAYFEKGYIVRTELKWLEPADNGLYFISLEYEYLNHAHTYKDWYKKYDSASGHDEEDLTRPVNYTMDKQIHQINLKYGRQEFWKHHWWFESYVGVGIRFKTAARDIAYVELDKLYHYHESAIRNISSQEGYFVTFALSIGIKFGRVFPRRS